MKKPVTYRRKKISKFVIAGICLLIVIFVGQAVMQIVMQMLAEMKYRNQRDQGTEIVEWEIGESSKICGCEVTITGIEQRDETEMELPEHQQMMVIQYQVQGDSLNELGISTLAYLRVDGQYLSSWEYIDSMAYLGKQTIYRPYIDQEQGELVFIVPEEAEDIAFIVQEYDDNVEPQQVKNVMLRYQPYEAPQLIHQYEIAIHK